MRWERLLLTDEPKRFKSDYTWLGKRVAALVEILDGVLNFVHPRRSYWSGRSSKFVVWASQRSIERRSKK